MAAEEHQKKQAIPDSGAGEKRSMVSDESWSRIFASGSADLMPSSSGILSLSGVRPSAVSRAASCFSRSARVAACSVRCGEVVEFGGIGGQVVEFGQMFVGRTVAVRVADEFPVVGADAAHVRRVGKLLLVVVFVKPRRCATRGRRRCASLRHERPWIFSSGGAPQRSSTLGAMSTVSTCSATTLPAGRPGPRATMRDADARLVHRALVHHAVLAFEQAVVAHEDDERVVELAALFQETRTSRPTLSSTLSTVPQ